MTPQGLETHYMHIRAFATSCYTSLCPLRTSQYLREQYEPLTETPLKFDRLFQACDLKLRKQHTPWTVQSHSTSVQARGGVARAASPCAACSGGEPAHVYGLPGETSVLQVELGPSHWLRAQSLSCRKLRLGPSCF